MLDESDNCRTNTLIPSEQTEYFRLSCGMTISHITDVFSRRRLVHHSISVSTLTDSTPNIVFIRHTIRILKMHFTFVPIFSFLITPALVYRACLTDVYTRVQDPYCIMPDNVDGFMLYTI
jgi:hypothetical protein